MEFDTISNITVNGTFDPGEEIRIERQNAMDVPILLSASAGIIADVIITYVILRNRELHTRTNIYISNICICNILYLVFTPLILNLFSAAENIHAYFICFSDELFFLFMLGNYIFICILSLDWYVVTYKSLNTSARCRAGYKTIIGAVWLMLFIFLVTVFLQCTTGVSLMNVIAIIAILVYLSSFIFIIGICFMKILNEKTSSVVTAKSHLEFYYVTAFFLCWFPNWLYIVGCAITKFTRSNVYLGLSTFAVGYFYSIILLIIMYKKDKKFGQALRSFLCSGQTDGEEEDIPKTDEHFTSLI